MNEIMICIWYAFTHTHAF